MEFARKCSVVGQPSSLVSKIFIIKNYYEQSIEFKMFACINSLIKKYNTKYGEMIYGQYTSVNEIDPKLFYVFKKIYLVSQLFFFFAASVLFLGDSQPSFSSVLKINIEVIN